MHAQGAARACQTPCPSLPTPPPAPPPPPAPRVRPQLFSAYDAPPEPVSFGLQLAQLVDALSTFACACDSSSLALSYPGPEAELVLE